MAASTTTIGSGEEGGVRLGVARASVVGRAVAVAVTVGGGGVGTSVGRVQFLRAAASEMSSGFTVGSGVFVGNGVAVGTVGLG